MLREQIVAIRAGAAAQVAMADAILRALDAPAAVAVPMAGGACGHAPERRQMTPRMGAPGAWRCECGKEGTE